MFERPAAAVLFACVLAAASCGGSGAPLAPDPPLPPPVPIPSDASPAVRAMLMDLPQFIQATLANQQASLPLNPQLAPQINAKIALLQRATLLSEIHAGRFYLESSATSSTGAAIPVVAIFPIEQMRGEAAEAMQVIQRGFPVLQAFMQTPFPAGSVRIWYGFKVGNSGGGGTINMEDRTTYVGRPGPMPYDAILQHELAHTYIGNESLTQFLEMYVHNAVQGGPPDAGGWAFRRDWVPMLDSNKDSAAVLDVYQLIGREAMSDAYRAAYPSRPPYGQPLAPAVRDVFVERAPAGSKDVAAQKMAAVTF